MEANAAVTLPDKAELVRRMNGVCDQPALSDFYDGVTRVLGGQTLDVRGIVLNLLAALMDSSECLVPDIANALFVDLPIYLDALLRDTPEIARAAKEYLAELRKKSGH